MITDNELCDFSDSLANLMALTHGLDLAIQGAGLPDGRNFDALMKLSELVRADIDKIIDTFDLLSRRLHVTKPPAMG